MKSLKDLFENYRVPVDESGWNAIADDPAVKKYNRSRLLRKATWYCAGTLVAAAVVFTALVLTRPQSQDATTTTTAPQEVRATVSSDQSATPMTSPSVSQAPATVANATAKSSPAPAEQPLMAIASPTTVKTESSSNPNVMPVVKTEVSSLLPHPSTIENVPEPASAQGPAKVNTANADNAVVRSEPDTLHPQQPQIADKLFFAPNAFSPNGDGVNDIFYAYANTEYTEFELNIYSRNGDHVFQSRNIENGWDGRRKGIGDLLPQGVYVYTIKYRTADNKSGVEKGQILLIR